MTTPDTTPPTPHVPPPPSQAHDLAPLLVAALLSFTVLVLVPAHVYVANRSSVLVFLSELLALASAFAVIPTLLLSGLLLLLRPQHRIPITTLVFGVACLLWFHAYCLVWPYDAFDGESIPWAQYWHRALIDAGLWLLVLVPLLWFAHRLYPRLALLSVGLLIIQIASLGISEHRTRGQQINFSKQYYVDKAPAFEFSHHRNVILVVLDEFQSDVFSRAILPKASYRQHFDGFTYFPDTVAGANYTEMALPAILTGRIYDNQLRREDYLRDAYLNHSVPAALKRSGWNVQLYPWRGFANESIYYHESIASNFVRRPQPFADLLSDIARLMDLGLFRCSPQFAKSLVYNDSNWWLSRLAASDSLRSWISPPTPPGSGSQLNEHAAGNTLDHLLIQMTLGAQPPELAFTHREGPDTFKLYHLAGLHVPVKLRRDLTMGTFDYNRANFEEQGEAYARIMGAFLAALRKAGAYDNSLIIILGDHGSGRRPDMHLNPGFTPRTAELDRTAVRNNFQRDKARGIPLLLIKGFGETGEIKISRAQASLVDIPSTILGAVGVRHTPVPALDRQPEFTGMPLSNLAEGESRIRYYCATRWSGDKSDHVNPITLYRIDGDSWLDDSWSYVATLTGKP
jgi:hypothetical protein